MTQLTKMNELLTLIMIFMLEIVILDFVNAELFCVYKSGFFCYNIHINHHENTSDSIRQINRK